MKFSLILILLLALLQQQALTAFLRPIPHLQSHPSLINNIFDNATIQITPNQMTLRLSDRIVSLLSVPDVRQSTSYTCGPSSLLAVLGYYQYFDWRQSQLGTLAKTTEEFGTSPQNLLSAIQQLGLAATMQQHMTIQNLEYYISCKQPIIIAFQAWADPGVDYKNDWDDGHYAVVIGYDKDYLYFEDPSLLGTIGYIPKAEFLDRWHDVDGGQRKFYNMGIVVKDMQKARPVIVKLE